jgi:molybdopterin molybdotransferase
MALESVRAEITAPVRSPAGRRSCLRGVIDCNRGLVTPLIGQGSHQVATLGQANALVIVPEGETVDVLVLP